MTELENFRSDTRAWLEANCPPEMREPIRSEADVCWGGRNWTFQSDAQQRWLEAMAARGWTVPDWPKDYGGGGLAPEEARVLKQEMQRIGARPPLTSGARSSGNGAAWPGIWREGHQVAEPPGEKRQ